MQRWKKGVVCNTVIRTQRRINRVGALIFAFLGCLLSCSAFANEVVVLQGAAATPNSALLSPYRVLNSTDGLPQNTVYAMATGPDGRIYVGTEDGLSRFDGVGFTRLSLTQAPREAEMPAAVNAIAVLGAQIWVGTDEAGLWHGDGERWQKIALNGAFEVGARSVTASATQTATATIGVTGIRTRSGGGVWVATTAGVFRCTGHNCVFQQVTAGLDVPEILEGRYHNQAVLWVAAEDQGVLAFEITPDANLAAVKAKFGIAQGLGNTLIRALANWQGALWIGTGRGLSRLRQDAAGQDEMTLWGRDDSAIAAGVFDLLPSLDSQQRPILHAATFGGGLIQMDAQDRWSALTVAQGLPENHLRSLLQSPGAGPIWIGTASSGIARADPGAWVAYTERHGLPHRSVIGVGKARFPDGVESYWLGTISGAVRLENGRWQAFLPSAIAARPIYDIAPRIAGGLWLASDVGLFNWDGKTLNKFSSDNSDLPGFTVLDIEQNGKTGALWLALRHGLAKIEGDQVSAIEGAAGARNLLYVDALAGGSMFVAGMDRLRWIKGDGSIQVIRQPCLAHPAIYSMALAAPAVGKPVEIWVGGRAGISRLRFDPGQGDSSKPDLRPHDVTIQCDQIDAATLGSNWIFEVKFDARGDLYAFGYNGALRLQVAALNALEPDLQRGSGRENPLKKLQIERFDQVDGLPDLEFNRGVMLDNYGRIWASNVGGAAIFDPKPQANLQPNAPLIFTALRVANKAYLANEVLPNGAELHARYRLLSYSRESRIRYRTQLLGLEAMPSVWTADASRNFARLPGGEYVLKVWAQDALGRPYGPIEHSFSVMLPWWRNPWLAVIAAVALIYSGTWLGRLRADALKRKALNLAQSLEAQVRTRTQELADANVQLETLALTDPLTGCYNRRCFYERYLHVPQNKPLLIILLDIDYFKKINDEFGHAGGDAVLVQFALRLQQACKPVFRMGGEEFMILEFAESAPAQQALLEKILRLISLQEFDLGGQKIRVTTSIGAACFSPPSEHTENQAQASHFEQVIRTADAALYQAKQAGRNRAELVEITTAIKISSGPAKFREQERSQEKHPSKD